MGNKARMLCFLVLASLHGLLGGPASSRQAPHPQEATELGMLTCSLAETDASPGAPTRDLLCHFRFGRQGSEETYLGTVQGVGQTRALYAKGIIMLAVKGPASTSIVPGVLQQTYSAGEASPASAAAPLVGQANNTIVLQPLSEEEGRVAAGKTRPDAAIITIELKLKASPA